MTNYLYPCFNWPGTIWFYSDPHFGDIEAQTFRNDNISDMEQVRRINQKVKKTDTLVMLGDIGDTSFMRMLHGYKVLVKGNHDRGKHYYEDSLFDEVYDGCLMINRKIILSHEPINFSYAFNIHGHDHRGIDFIDHVLKYYDCDMPSFMRTENYLSTIFRDNLSHLNVCAEWINYTPINLSKIYKSGILRSVLDVHSIPIATCTN